MNRDLAILGLREGASKEQIQAAYEYRLRRYKAADFSDDPDYVRRKSEQLKRAFDATYAAAGTTNLAEETRTYEPKAYQPREYEPEKYDHDEFERDRKSAAEKGDHEVKFSDLNKLKDIGKSMGANLAGKVKEFAEAAKGTTDNSPPPLPKLAKEESNLQMRNRETSERDSWEETTETDETYTHNENTATGSSDGQGMLKAVLTIISILIVIASSAMTMCDDRSTGDVSSDYMEDYYYDNELDMKVNTTALDLQDTVHNLDLDAEYTVDSYGSAELEKAGKEFAKKYFDQESVQILGEYVYDNYGEYLNETRKTDTEGILNDVLAYYQFPSLIEAEGYISPYNEEAMVTLVDYLNYLCDYFDEYGFTNE